MPPKPPLFVNQVIPKAIEVLNEHQARILSITGTGAPLVQPELQRVLEICKQLIEPAPEDA